MVTVSKKVLWVIFFIICFIIVTFFLNFLLSAQNCRRWYGNPQQETGAIIEGEYDNDILYMSIINTRFCLISLEENKDPVFPDTSLRLKIGFFDRWWRLHIYNARMGGKLSDGTKVEIPICINRRGGQKCSLFSVNKAKELLKGKTFIKGNIIYKDTAPWKNAEQIKKYDDLFIKLKNALLDHNGYPNISVKNADFVIQVWQIEI